LWRPLKRNVVSQRTMNTIHLMSIRKKIILVFVAYLLVIAFFGIVYSIIYYNDHTAFSFNSEIKEKNLESHLIDLSKTMKEDYLVDLKKLKKIQ